MARRDVLIRQSQGAGLSIAAENALTGTALPTITLAGSTSTLHGFAREFSVQAGNTQTFSCHGTTASAIDIYRLGYYGGSGARLVTTVTNTGTSQSAPASISGSNGAITCTGWSTTASWAVPADATSGFYVGVLRNSGSSALFWIPFIVRRDDRTADVMYKTADATWALAYNNYNTPTVPLAGKSYYATYASDGSTTWDIENRAHAATYHRPITTRSRHTETYWLNAEAPMIRWLERNGYDVTYSACKDWRDAPTAPTLADCRVYVSCGHDEYWSVGMRSKWAAKQTAGKHSLHFAGNDVFWRTRYGDELSQGGDGNTQWCYKDTMTGPSSHTAGTALDPVTPTGTWKDTRAFNSAVRAPEAALTGTNFIMNYPGTEYALVTAAGNATLNTSFWRGTTAFASGVNVAGLIGFEANEFAPTEPSGSYVRHSTTSVNPGNNIADANGEVYTNSGTFSHGVVSQRRSSGAVVFSTGTCQWSWGLDDGHDRGSSVAATVIRQATMNLLTDLGATAATPQSGLSVPSAVNLNNYGLVP